MYSTLGVRGEPDLVAISPAVINRLAKILYKN